MTQKAERSGRLTIAVFLGALACIQARADQVKTDKGSIEGSTSANSAIRIYKGIPFAAPPVGDLRWKPPQPAPSWAGVRKATEFGARCMQGPIYSDMVFRDKGPSEDCLYLNVWTQAKADQRLPVMVWIYGGGFAAGASSEPRQDGENLAKKGVVVVSLNYRLGIFGFFTHADLAKESEQKASGNYGLLDQVAALQWVKKNIASFGGDPGNVTIFGESAGSFSVSALMASPLTQGLINRAIGESGAFFSRTLTTKRLSESEEADAKFAKSTLGTDSLAALRAKSADEILQGALKERNVVRFSPNIDGYFLPEDVYRIYASGGQAHVPLLAGWNSDEGSYKQVFHDEKPTAENFAAWARKQFGDKTETFLKLYPGGTDEQAKRSAQDYAGDQFIAYSTWKWIEMQGETGKSAVFRYRFEQAPPAAPGSTAESRGAYHSAEIEFVFGALASKKLPWRPQDEHLSEVMSSYWSNFARNGDPNGAGLPQWPSYRRETGYKVMHLNASPEAAGDEHRDRYEFLDSLMPGK